MADIPGDTYPGIEAGTPTLGVAALWVVAAELDEELVYEITRALWHPDTLAKLAEGHPKGAEIVLANALRGVVDPAPSRCGPLLPRAGPDRVSLVDALPMAAAAAGRPQPAIVVDGLAKSYGAVTAVAGLSFTIRRGQTVALLGPQRRRQDHDHRHAAGPARAQRRHDPHPGRGRCRATGRASCRG